MELDAEDFADELSCISFLLPQHVPLDTSEGSFEISGKIAADE
jgi:hypothetical protein